MTLDLSCRRLGWRCWLLLLLWAGVCLPVVAHARAPAVAEQKNWKRLQTPNFELLGNTGDRDLREVAERLEQFRDAMGMLFPNVKQDAAVLTRVLVFRNHKTFDPFKPLYNGKPAAVGGYFVRGHDVNQITLTVENLDDNVGVIYHEFVHLLMADAIGSLPPWVTEGLAEYYSSFETAPDGKKVHLGRPHSWHVQRLREEWLPLTTLVGAGRDSTHYNERDKRGVFYAESWALVHYLLLGHKQQYAPHAAAFVNALATGRTLEQACREVLKIEPAQLERELRMYIRNGQFMWQAASFPERLERLAAIPVSSLPEADAHAALGDLLWRIDRAADAEAQLGRALALEPDSAPAHATLGQVRLRANSRDQALAHLEQAAHSPRATYLTHYQYAAVLGQTAQADGGTGQPDLLAKQEAALRRAIELNPRFADAYHLLAVLKGRRRESAAEALTLAQQASDLAPGRQAYLLTTAYIHAALDNVAAARAITKALAAQASDTELRDRARTLDGQLEAYAGQRQAAAAAAAAHARPAAAPDVPPADAAAVPPATRPVLREVQDGESRATGYLVAIDCQPQAIRLHVDAQGTPLVFRAARFDEVDFISYRQDLTGNIACGKRAVLDPVIVSYRGGGTAVAGAAGTAVAVEFVPKDFALPKHGR